MLGLKEPTPAARRSRYLREQFNEFMKGDEPHWSPSGMTALLFAERALEMGVAVTLAIHPRHGAVLKKGDADVWPSV